jgi:hypothetical protein
MKRNYNELRRGDREPLNDQEDLRNLVLRHTSKRPAVRSIKYRRLYRVGIFAQH